MLRLLAWNARGLTDGKLSLGLPEYLRQFDVVMLTETQREHIPEQLFQGYAVSDTPATRDGRAGEGQLIAIRRSRNYTVTAHSQDASCIWMRLQPAGSCQPPLLLGVSYIPVAGSRQLSRVSLDERFDSLAEAVLTEPDSPAVLGGDFNTQLSPPNSRSRALLAACETCSLGVCTGELPGDEAAAPSRRGAQGQQDTRIDHWLANEAARPALLEARVGAQRWGSDHWPLEAQLQLQCQPPAVVPCAGTPLPRRTWQPAARDSYAQALAAQLNSASEPDHTDPEASLARVHAAISAAADSSGMAARQAPASQARQGRPYHEPFWDQECQQSKRRLRAASPNSKPRLERRHHKLVRRKARAYREQRVRAQLSSRCLQQRSFWQQLRRPGASMPEALQHVQAWDPYMQRAANAGLPPGLALPAHAYPAHPSGPAEALNEAITEREVLAALARLHNGRAVGHLGFPAELFRYAQPQQQPGQPQPQHVLAPALTAALNSMFSTGRVPAAANIGLITPIHKRGDQLSPDNYCPIAVPDTVNKLFSSVLLQRLLDFTEQRSLRAQSQAGFRPQQSVVHQLFTLEHLRQRQQHSGQRLYVCFLDLKGAFDRVSRPLLWEALERLGLHGRMLAAVQALYSTASIAVRLQGRAGPAFSSDTGVKQGCPLSPTLFGILADGLHRTLQLLDTASGIRLSPSLSITDLGYADDFALVSSTPQGLQRLIDTADYWAGNVGMQISPDKTVVMEMTSAQPAAISWFCGGRQLQSVQQARYLGMRFQAGKGFLPTFAWLRQQLCGANALVRRQYGRLDCSNSVWLQLQLHQTCVVPAGSFACEIWGPSVLTGAARKGRARLETCCLGQIKRMAGLRGSVASPIVCRELGVMPLRHVWLLRAAKFWNGLAAGDAFHKAVALDCVTEAIRGRDNWVRGLSSELASVGYPMQLGEVMHPIEIGALRSRLSANLDAVWAGLAVSPRLCPTNGARLCTYLRWFARPQGCATDLLRLPLPHRAMVRLLRFRTGCHRLPSMTGSFSGVPRSERRCPLCDSHYPDERHVLLECPSLGALRQEFSTLFVEGQTLRMFMWQQDVPLLAKFIARCENAVQTAV